MPVNRTCRIANRDDAPAVQAFLAQRSDSSLFLLSFLTQGGIVDEGKPLQGTYAIARTNGNVAGVAMHGWNNIVYLQAPELAPELVSLAAQSTARPIKALGGPGEHVKAALRGVPGKTVRREAIETLFALDLRHIKEPDMLSGSGVILRRAERHDLEFLRNWRFDYEIECSGLPNNADTRSFANANIEGHVERGEAFILAAAGQPVALCTHNARVAQTVQIGGVWTPPTLRGRGYARAVVAGALRVAQREDMTRAVLFTENPAAIRAYEALGFTAVGDFGIIVFDE